MHLTLVVGPAVVHAGVWDEERSVANARVQLRTMGVCVTPLSSRTILASLEAALTQLATTVDLADITSINGATYPALVPTTTPDHHPVRDAFAQDLPSAEGVPLAKWMEVTLHGLPEEDKTGADAPTAEIGRTAAHWRSGWGLDCAVLPFLSLSLAAALSTGPGPLDMVLLHDDLDMLVLPSSNILGASVVQDPNGRVGRMLLRDKYANGRWSVLSHLALLFAPGGSIGVDNKRFAFVRPFSATAGTVRFEHGAPVDEFYDLRANTRCVLESQVLTYKQATGTHFPTRIILLTDDDNPAVPHLLAGVFNCPILTPVSPTTSTPASAAGYGCALLAAAGDVAGVHALLASQHAPHFGHRTPPHGHTTTLPTPPCISRATSFLQLGLTSHSPPKRLQAPPSPAASESGDEVEPWLRELEGAPADKWECTIYAAIMPEFARIRALVDSGVVHPGVF